MEIYLVQHGEAVSKEVDPERRLNDKGEADVLRIAAHLKVKGVEVHRVLHSGKLRAQQTAKILADHLLREGSVEVIDDIKPNDTVSGFSFDSHHIKNGTMLVGHLPFMTKMVSWLVTGNEEPIIVDYLPGSVACLASDDEGRWRLQWLLRPDVV